MIRDVTLTKNIVSIDWDQEDYDAFFRAGLQLVCDDHFNGERKVVVVPASNVKLDKKAKTIEVSEEFSLMCVERAVNQAIREGIARAEAQLQAGKANTCSCRVSKKPTKKIVKKVAKKKAK